MTTPSTTPAPGSTSAELRVPNPWHRLGPETFADLTVTELDVAPRGHVIRIAWVHERADNPGPSITNAAEAVYRAVQRLAGPCHVVEHYDEASYLGGRHLPEQFDLVTLDEQGEAHWRHMGRSPADVVAELVIAAAQGRRPGRP